MRTDPVLARVVAFLLFGLFVFSGCASLPDKIAPVCAVPGAVVGAGESPESYASRLADSGDEDEDGMSGSGVAPSDADEDGISGTGIRGTLTGFGSACINGRRVPYAPFVSVSVDGSPSNLESLRVGQVLAVDAAGEGDLVRARSIDVQHEIVGPITRVQTGSIEVMGAHVDLTHAAIRSQLELARGTRVAVSGLRRVDGSIVATRVDAALGSRESFVRGVPRESEAAVRVGGVAIERMQGSASLATRYGEGRIRVSGSWDAERETLDVTRVDESPTVSRGPREVDIEGYVRSVHGHELRIGEVTIVASSTGMANAINSLEVDDRIRIRATRKGEGAGTFDVKSIERVSVNALLQILKKAGGAGGGARADGPVGSKKDKPEHPAHPSHPGQSARPVSAGNSSNASQARSSRPTRPAVAQSAMRPARPARVERPSRPQRPERPNAARPTVDRPRGAGRGGRN